MSTLTTILFTICIIGLIVYLFSLPFLLYKKMEEEETDEFFCGAHEFEADTDKCDKQCDSCKHYSKYLN